MFFRINNSDPFKAVSWDRLHAYGIGLFGDHIWEEITNLIKEDHDDFREVDKQ